MNDAFNRELERERECERHELDQSVLTNEPLLIPQQKEVYDTLIKATVYGMDYFSLAPLVKLGRHSSYH